MAHLPPAPWEHMAVECRVQIRQPVQKQTLSSVFNDQIYRLAIKQHS